MIEILNEATNATSSDTEELSNQLNNNVLLNNSDTSSEITSSNSEITPEISSNVPYPRDFNEMLQELDNSGKIKHALNVS